jgi:hypothetical protein
MGNTLLLSLNFIRRKVNQQNCILKTEIHSQSQCIQAVGNQNRPRRSKLIRLDISAGIHYFQPGNGLLGTSPNRKAEVW